MMKDFRKYYPNFNSVLEEISGVYKDDIDSIIDDIKSELEGRSIAIEDVSGMSNFSKKCMDGFSKLWKIFKSAATWPAKVNIVKKLSENLPGIFGSTPTNDSQAFKSFFMKFSSGNQPNPRLYLIDMVALSDFLKRNYLDDIDLDNPFDKLRAAVQFMVDFISFERFYLEEISKSSYENEDDAVINKYAGLNIPGITNKEQRDSELKRELSNVRSRRWTDFPRDIKKYDSALRRIMPDIDLERDDYGRIKAFRSNGRPKCSTIIGWSSSEIGNFDTVEKLEDGSIEALKSKIEKIFIESVPQQLKDFFK